MKLLPEKTFISLSAVGVILMAVFWGAGFYFEAVQTAEAVASLRAKQDEYTDAVNEIRVRLGVIEAEQKATREYVNGIYKKVGDIDDRLTIRFRRDERDAEESGF